MFRYRPKDNIFKTLRSYAKNYVHEVKNSIKSSKIVKNGPQIVKNKNFQENFFFCFFYVIMSLHAKNCACRSNGVACGQYKDKEEKTLKKVKKGHKNVKNENFEKRKKCFLPKAIKNIFSKNQVAGLKIVACSVLTDKQTKKQRQRQPFQGFRSSSLQPIIKERSNNTGTRY